MIINYNPLQSTSQLLTQIERPVCEEKTKQKCKDEPQEKCQQVDSFAFVTYNKFLCLHLLWFQYVFVKIGMCICEDRDVLCICQDCHVYLSRFPCVFVLIAISNSRDCQEHLSSWFVKVKREQCSTVPKKTCRSVPKEVIINKNINALVVCQRC